MLTTSEQVSNFTDLTLLGLLVL